MEIIAKTTLADDQGAKRLLHEDLDIKKYWIFDVQGLKIMAFTMQNHGSFKIKKS
ncbi:MAG: hypothetical protein F6K14_06155 [Symploca sp. SIO2C1]|nr:hypothetical protein [Symploca sp. SIO2C1]